MKIVRSFATSANLGPGFDCLCICFDLYNEYEFFLSDKYTIEGFSEKFSNPSDNLIVKSYEKVFLLKNKKIQFLTIRQKIQNIPVSRGLGSSASCIVAGIIMANEILGGILSKDEIFQIASMIEGHPDNVAPLIFGGFTCSFQEDKYHYINLDVASNLQFFFLIPNFELSTEVARASLPSCVLLEEVVSTLSHSILMVKALEKGDFSLLKMAKKDLIHEPYRYQFIDPKKEMRKILEDYEDIVGLISGAGPSILLISEQDIKNKFSIKNWQLVSVKISNVGAYVYER